ncbi:MAG: alpha/beta hydrolase [Opitutaceae bacterium]|jgi:acetyl esterase/lipase|nr:alpha/beta hydrolase [Opitutaceae bacterium]
MWLPRLLAFAFAVSCACAGEPRVIELWPEGVPGLRADAGPEREESGRFLNIHRPSLVVYPPLSGGGAAAGTAVIYAPGGGYVRVAAGAGGGEITRWLNQAGVTVFLLKYRNGEYGHPAPLRDALRAVRIVRSRAVEFGVVPDRIGLLGGSAGGHLAASVGTLFDDPEGRTGAALDAVSGRPDFMILVFPVISMTAPHAHAPSRRALLGESPAREIAVKLSVEKQVTLRTPPAFIVHSAEDAVVPVENSLDFYRALRAAGVPAELHLYPRGPHGSGLSSSLGPIAEWPRLCEAWMRHNGWLPAGSRP